MKMQTYEFDAFGGPYRVTALDPGFFQVETIDLETGKPFLQRTPDIIEFRGDLDAVAEYLLRI